MKAAKVKGLLLAIALAVAVTEIAVSEVARHRVLLDVGVLGARLPGAFLLGLAHLEAHGLSQRAFAEQHGYTTRDLSLVRKHERNVEEGKRKHRRDKIEILDL